MNKKNFLFLILGVILLAALISAISFLVRKYERDSMPAQQLVPRQVPDPKGYVQEKSLEDTAPVEQSDNQFPTENGKFLQ
jgi:hypothetical protein